MKLVKLKVVRVALPCDAGRRRDDNLRAGEAYNMAMAPLTEMESLMVEVTTDTGLTGWGEAFGHLANPVTFAALAGPVGRFFMGRSIGHSPDGLRALRAEAEEAFHGFGRTGPFVYALSAIDTALWDIHAKRAGVPLHVLLGSDRRTVDTYASLVSYGNDPLEVATQVRRARGRGFRRIKLHETTYEAIAAARDAAPDAELMVDVNCAWPFSDAARRLRDLRDLGLRWVEEPVWPPDDVAGLALLRERGVAIAAGENASGVGGVLDHLRQHAVDIVQPSVAKVGGVSAMLDVFDAARAHGIEVVPHCFYVGPGLLATAHLVASLPAGTPLEVPLLDWPTPLYPDLASGAQLELPDVPGLGHQPDPLVMASCMRDEVTLEAPIC